jgi:N-acetylglutamate synthase-like GNAT family acetyltransferase
MVAVSLILLDNTDMNEIKIRLTTPSDKDRISELMEKYWGGEPLVIRAKNYYPSRLDGILALRGEEIIGFLFFDIQDSACEIIVFEVFDKTKGLGTTILEKLKDLAKHKGCKRIFLMTTNDNLDALRFYQRRGFHICAVHIDSVKESRKMKPGIPMNGEYGIPIRDEIDLELLFQ